MPMPIMELPTELRALIYNELPQADAFNARLVCKQWKDEIDEFYIFEGHINTRQLNWRQILQFPMRTCIIDCLEEEAHEQEQQDETAAAAAVVVGEGDQIEQASKPILQLSDFKYPGKLERLIMTGTTLISASLAYKLLTSDLFSCLRELYFPLKLLYSSDPIGSLSEMRLAHLSSLELQVHAGIYVARGQQAIANHFVDILTNQSLTGLKSLKLEINLGVSITSTAPNITSKYIFAILACLNQQSDRLESFTLDFMGGTDPDAAVYLYQIHTRNSGVCHTFRNVQHVKKLNISFDSETYTEVWTRFLEQQQSLVSVEFNGVWEEKLLHLFVPRNFDTLQTVSICCPIQSRADKCKSIDCKIFSNCWNLKTLKLKLDNHHTLGNISRIYDLPDSLVNFEIEGCEIDSEELAEHAAEYAAPLSSPFLLRCMLHNLWSHREGICRLIALISILCCAKYLGYY